MPDPLTPLPITGPTQGLDAPAVKSPAWSRQPLPISTDPTASPWPSPKLPPLSVEESAASSAVQASKLTPVPSATASDFTPGNAPAAHSSSGLVRQDVPEFSDADLVQAFAPIIEHVVHSAIYTKENVMDNYLEPMLRATIRRALAESTPGSRPFHHPVPSTVSSGICKRFLPVALTRTSFSRKPTASKSAKFSWWMPPASRSSRLRVAIRPATRRPAAWKARSSA